MFALELAGVRILVDNRYPYLERQCKEYMTEETDAAFSVRATDEEIAEEQTFEISDPGYCESICVYRKICGILPEYGIFLFHAATVEKDGRAYAFSAPSGTGKSTHVALWMKYIPGVRVINGDKPLLRMEPDGSFTVFGTPWNGKEHWGTKTSAKLCAVCMLARGEENRIQPISDTEAVPLLLRQLFMTGDRASLDKRLFMLDALVTKVPIYRLYCTISKEAAELSYETMRKN